jgi:SET domain-containing protein
MEISSNNLIVKKTKNKIGLGVFAGKDFDNREVVEILPIIKIPISEFRLIKGTILKLYFFEYDKNYICICLGYGSLYNHSYAPNARYLYDFKNETVIIKAIKRIKKGEEIFINYNYYPNSKTELKKWFDPNFVDLVNKSD